MYEDFEIFIRDALNCRAGYYPDKSLDPQEIETAVKIYRNAKQGTTLLDADDNRIAFGVTIVGRLALKVKTCTENGQEEYSWLPSNESFPSIDEIMKQNLGIVDEDTREPGSILAISNWSLCWRTMPGFSADFTPKQNSTSLPRSVGKIYGMKRRRE